MRGEPLGILRETARYLAYEKQPAKSAEEIKELLVRAMDEAAAVGITSVQSDDFETFSDKDWRKVVKAYKELEAEGKNEGACMSSAFCRISPGSRNFR